MLKRLMIILALFALVCAGWTLDSSSASDVRTLTILHTNDTHAHTLPDEKGMGGYASLSTCLKSIKAGRSDVLVLDAGDQITGTPVSSLFNGKPIYEIMNTMPYDFACLGNHEFDHGWMEISKFKKICKFPLLCANVFTPKGTLVGDGATASIKINGIRIGIVAPLTSDLYRATNELGHKGLLVKNATDVVNDYIPSLRKQSDLVIVLSHCGVDEDKRIAASISGIDLIVGGHAHVRLEQPALVNRTLIVQAGSNTECVGRLDLEVDLTARVIVKYKEALVPINGTSFPPDGETVKIIQKWEAKVSPIVDVQIGMNSDSKSPEDLTKIIGGILKRKCGADYGYQNAGGTRGSLPKGPITKRQIWTILPFADNAAVVRVKGESLEKIFKIEPEGDSDREYTVATNQFTADQAVARKALRQQDVTTHPALLRDLVIEYIEKNGNMDMPVK